MVLSSNVVSIMIYGIGWSFSDSKVLRVSQCMLYTLYVFCPDRVVFLVSRAQMPAVVSRSTHSKLEVVNDRRW